MGYYDEAGNRLALERLVSAVRPGGMFVLEMGHRDGILANFGPRHWKTLPDGTVIWIERAFDPVRGPVATVKTAGVTVVFSALTVAVALCGLFVFDVPALHSLAAGGVGVVLFAMLAAVTLLPSMLAGCGRRIRPAMSCRSDHGYFWGLSRIVQRRAVPVVTVVAVGLALLAVPFRHARFEQPDPLPAPRRSVTAAVRPLPRPFPGRRPEHHHPSWPTSPAKTRASGRGSTPCAVEPDVAAVTVDDDFPPTVTVVDVVPRRGSQGQAS